MDDLRPEFPDVIDSTMRSDYVNCGMKFMYSRLYGLSSLGGSVHLIAGGAFARGLEVARREYYQLQRTESEAVASGVLAAWEKYGDFEPEDKYKSKSADRVGYAICEYFAEYPMPTDRIQPYRLPNGLPAIEFSFTFPLQTTHPVTGNPLLYGGRFDLVGEYQSDLWVVDEKTTTRLGPQWLRSFTLRGQLLGYTYAAKRFGLPVNGFVVRGLSFLKDYYGHAELFEVVPQYRLDQWREQIEVDAARMVDDWSNGRYNYAFGDACNNYGGCPFQRLCTKQEWKPWWQQYFEVDRWNPLEDLEATKSLDQTVESLLNEKRNA